MKRDTKKIKEAVGAFETSLDMLRARHIELEEAKAALEKAQKKYADAQEVCKQRVQEVKNACSEEWNSLSFDDRVRHSAIPFWSVTKNELLAAVNRL